VYSFALPRDSRP